MSKDDRYAECPEHKKDERIIQLLCHMELQLRVMEAVKNEVASLLEEKKAPSAFVREKKTKYKTGGFMADYIMNEGGELLEIHYDWVP